MALSWQRILRQDTTSYIAREKSDVLESPTFQVCFKGHCEENERLLMKYLPYEHEELNPTLRIHIFKKLWGLQNKMPVTQAGRVKFLSLASM